MQTIFNDTRYSFRALSGNPGFAVAGLLATVSAVACAIPAVRAARVDPMLVLRDQ